MVRRRRIHACVAAVAAALAIAACGGDDGGVEDTDPASLAPADAPLYVQATLRPQGKLKRDTESVAGAISGLDDPTARLVEELDQAFEEDPTRDPNFTFGDDIEPWLGERAGVFVDGFSEDPGAAIVQSTDPEASREAAQGSCTRPCEERTYEGVTYYMDPDGDSAGVVGDFFVAGDERAFKQAVDVAEGEDSLGDQGEFTDALAEAPENSIGDVYLSLEELTREIRAEEPESAEGIEASLGETEGKTALASLVPSPDSLEIDFATNADTGVEMADLGSLIETFPADSFAAVGVPDLGGIVDNTIDQLEQQRVEGLSREAIDEQLSQLGLSLDDVSRALGDLGVFATGSDEGSLQGAAVITSRDQEAARDLISKLTAITGLAQLSGDPSINRAPVGSGISITDPEEIGPQPLIVTTLDDRIAIGYGEQATERALQEGGGETLADDPTYGDAVEALGGDGLSGYLDFPAIFRLAESLGAAADPGYRQAKPYLDSLTYGVFGGGEDGDLRSSKVIVGVR